MLHPQESNPFLPGLGVEWSALRGGEEVIHQDQSLKKATQAEARHAGFLSLENWFSSANISFASRVCDYPIFLPLPAEGNKQITLN